MPKYTSVRIRFESCQKLQQFAKELNISTAEMLDKVVNAYERQIYLERLNADFAALRADLVAWREELEERRIWDATLADDLDEEY